MKDSTDVVATAQNAPQLRNLAADKLNLMENRAALPYENLMNISALIINIYIYLAILSLRHYD